MSCFEGGGGIGKREIDCMMTVATNIWKMEDLILSKFGQHIEVTDWIIGATIHSRKEGHTKISQLSQWLDSGFDTDQMTVLRDIMNEVARVPQQNMFCAVGWVSKFPPPVGPNVDDIMLPAE